jgi:hypothetical protein
MAGMDVWEALERQHERKGCRALRWEAVAQNRSKKGFNALHNSPGINTHDFLVSPAGNHDLSKVPDFRTNFSIQNP